jgi:DNA-binding transcriptional regulator YhcF (GntR family)
MENADSSDHTKTNVHNFSRGKIEMKGNEDGNKSFVISVDLSSKKPIFEQIIENIIDLIAYGEIKPGTILPSTRKIASLLGVNYHTVNKAYEVLIREGYAIMEKRRVVIVDQKNHGKDIVFQERWEDKAKSLIAEAMSKGYSKEDLLVSLQKIMERIEKGEK